MKDDTLSPERFAANLLSVAEYYQEALSLLMTRQDIQEAVTAATPADALVAYQDMLASWLANPEKLNRFQQEWYAEFSALCQHATQRFLGEAATPLYTASSKDNRFKHTVWEDHAWFDFIKQYYFFSSEWLQKWVHATEGLDKNQEKKLDFYTRQFIDALSPANFLLTNPEALKETVETNGENLVNGLKHLIKDIKRCKDGPLSIQTANLDAFTIGETIAATPGKVIYQNALMQLIHYTPVQSKNFARPLLIIPAWINKYYILDLQPKYSFVAWLLAQGYSVFMISWINPDEQHAAIHFEDYMEQGPLAALDAIGEATGSPDITAIGYCLGGTLLACTLAYLKAKKDKRIKAASFLTTMLDFSDAGEISIFMDDEQISRMEASMQEKGYLEGSQMAATFNMLRANDMIWSVMVNNYLLGKEPFPFDLLYWNADTTRLPAAMHSFYLRNMYQYNKLRQPKGITLKQVPINLHSITTPSYILSTKEDHIAPWKSTFAALDILQGPVRFTLSASGHVAGVVNHPDKHKYCYWVNGKEGISPDEWLQTAQEHPGSWWEDWHQWNASYSGKKVSAYSPGQGKVDSIEDAPGTYVKKKY